MKNMDRTQEMAEMAARLVAMLIEDRSRMTREVEQLREAVEKLQKTVEAMGAAVPQVPAAQKSVEEPAQTAEPDVKPEAPEIEVELAVEPEPAPASEVLRPRDREEQIKDTSEWGMFFNSDIDVSFDDGGESIIGDLMDFQEKPAEPVWMTDAPGPRVNSVYDAISNEDRVLFISELFDGDGEQFSLTMDRIDESPDFGQVVKEMKIAFPDWDDASEPVYRFYMMARRRFV